MNFALLVPNLPDIYPQCALQVQEAPFVASAFKRLIARLLGRRPSYGCV